MGLPKLLTGPEVAALLRLSNKSLGKLVRAGTVPGAVKLPGMGWRFRADHIARLVGGAK